MQTISSFTVVRKDLAELLKFHTTQIIEKRNTIPVLSNVRLSLSAQMLYLSSTDLDMMLHDQLPAAYADDGISTFDVTVDAAWLEKGLSNMEGTLVTMSQEDGKLIVTDNEITIRPPIISSDDMPTPAPLQTNPEPIATIVVSAQQLVHDLKRVGKSMSNEETRFYLRGIYIHVVDESYVSFAATDGHKLMVIERPDILESGVSPDAIVGQKMIGCIIKMLDKAKDTAKLVFYANKGSTYRVDLEWNGRILRSKTVDGTFPDYMRVVPPTRDKTLVADQKHFAARLKKITALAGSARHKGIHIQDGKFTVQDYNLGAAEVKVDYVASKDFPAKVGFFTHNLVPVIDVLEGELTIAMEDDSSPGLFTGSASPEIICVLMPAR